MVSYSCAILENPRKKLISGEIYLHKNQDAPLTFWWKNIFYNVLNEEHGQEADRVLNIFQAGIEYKRTKLLITHNVFIHFIFSHITDNGSPIYWGYYGKNSSKSCKAVQSN